MKRHIFAAIGCVTLSCAICIGDDAVPMQPKSKAAVDSIQKHDAAAGNARDSYYNSLLAADKQEVADLQPAMLAATAGGNLDEAEAIRSERAAIADDEKQQTNALTNKAEVAKWVAWHVKMDDGSDNTFWLMPDGKAFTPDGHGTWQRQGDTVTIDWPDAGHSDTIEVSSIGAPIRGSDDDNKLITIASVGTDVTGELPPPDEKNGGDSKSPKSDTAASAKHKLARAAGQAREAYYKAMIAADKQEVTDLQRAMLVATKSGDLDEAEAIKSNRDAATADQKAQEGFLSGKSGVTVASVLRCWCTIINKGNGLALSVTSNDKNPGNGAELRIRDDVDNQKWALDPLAGGVNIVNKYSGRVIGVRQNLLDAGIDVIEWTPRGEAKKPEWRLEPLGNSFKIVNVISGHCLTPKPNGDGAMTITVQEPWSRSANQLWEIRPTK